MIVTLINKIPGDCDIYFPDEVGEAIAYGEMLVTLVAKE